MYNFYDLTGNWRAMRLPFIFLCERPNRHVLCLDMRNSCLVRSGSLPGVGETQNLQNYSEFLRCILNCHCMHGFKDRKTGIYGDPGLVFMALYC